MWLSQMDFLNGGVEDLHRDPVFLPYSPYIQRSLIRVALFSLGIHGCHQLSRFAFEIQREGKPAHPTDRPSILSYYVVHLLAAIVLGGYGLYVYPTQPSFQTLDARDKIANFVEMIPFGELQIAYQIWGLRVGNVSFMEPFEMKLHHTIVIFLGVVVSCFTNGFRCYAPFFFGVVELSSVPLNVMNIFKNDKGLAEAYPQSNVIVSLVFAATFLYVRNFLLMQAIWDFSKVVMILMTSCEGSNRMELSVCMAPYVGTLALSALLTSLQVIWGYKIVMRLLKLAGLVSSRSASLSSRKPVKKLA